MCECLWDEFKRGQTEEIQVWESDFNNVASHNFPVVTFWIWQIDNTVIKDDPVFSVFTSDLFNKAPAFTVDKEMFALNVISLLS